MEPWTDSRSQRTDAGCVKTLRDFHAYLPFYVGKAFGHALVLRTACSLASLCTGTLPSFCFGVVSTPENHLKADVHLPAALIKYFLFV